MTNLKEITHKSLNVLDDLFKHGIVTNFTGLVLVMFLPAFINIISNNITGDLRIIGLGISLLYTGLVFFIIKNRMDYTYFGVGLLKGLYSTSVWGETVPSALSGIGKMCDYLILFLLISQLIYTVCLLKEEEWREENR